MDGAGVFILHSIQQSAITDSWVNSPQDVHD
jgi:hypothetical protein